MIKLKPCPFCGKECAAVSDIRDIEVCANFDICNDDEVCENFENAGNCGLKFVVCDFTQGGCGAATGWYHGEKEAIAAWNERKESEDE